MKSGIGHQQIGRHLRSSASAPTRRAPVPACSTKGETNRLLSVVANATILSGEATTGTPHWLVPWHESGGNQPVIDAAAQGIEQSVPGTLA